MRARGNLLRAFATVARKPVAAGAGAMKGIQQRGSLRQHWDRINEQILNG